MPRPLLFIDLAGTLDVRDPVTGRWGVWPGAEPVLADLAADHDLHLTTGDAPGGAHAWLVELGLRQHFTAVHAGLPGGGKPFGAIAAQLGVDPAHCLAVGDNPVSDTAGDSEEVVSVLLEHRPRLVTPARVAEVVGALAAAGSFLAGFEAALEAATADETVRMSRSTMGGGCRLGWWAKATDERRPVVVMTG